MKAEIIAIYLRISKEQLKGSAALEDNSIKNQRCYLYDYIQSKQEWSGSLVEEFVDSGYSGTSFQRPGWQALVKACQRQRINCVIVKDFSRLGRNYTELGYYLESFFPNLQIRFISINDCYDSGSLVKGDETDLAFRNIIYDLYSKDLSQKVYSAVGARMQQGTYLPGTPPFGYKNDRGQRQRIVDPEAAAIVRRIFYDAVLGLKTDEIAKRLNDEGVPVPLQYKHLHGMLVNRKGGAGMKWNRQKVTRIIRNEAYLGTMVYRKQKTLFVGEAIRRKQSKENWIILAAHHEPIVDQDIFEIANQKLSRRSKEGRAKQTQPQPQVHPFFCGHCHHRLIRRNAARPYYRCGIAACYERRKAEESFFKEDQLEQLLLKAWQEESRYRNDSRDQEEQRVWLYQEYRCGNISKTTYCQAKESLSQSELALLKTALVEVLVYGQKEIKVIWQP